ncbi:SufS family cysteine desulfurase [Treponema pedis]|uniref:SufS family cysteine desulfurase n=1 Tax=Treponema pedis TaxID=409322 RepID=UPI000418E3AC|nr:SufS family cysteine desulfurase [Treponema pedis]
MYKKDFPLISENPGIHYLDSAATAQRPKTVIDGVTNYFTHSNGNAGRGSHSLAIASSILIEETRKKTADFIGAKDIESIIFTKNCTEALNIISYCYALPFLKKDDEILIAISNHHANLVTWQFAAKQTGAKLKYIYLQKDGSLNIEDFKQKLSDKTKIVAVSSVVNATGVINPVREITALSHEKGAAVVVDASQAVTHFKQNVTEADCDFLTFSGHKLFSAFGVGVLYGKKELLEKMPPFLYGGDMINFVTEHDAEFKDLPHKYEGGTLDSSAIVSLKFAIEYVEAIGYEKIGKIISDLESYALSELKKLDFVETYNTEAGERAGIIAFNVKDVHSHDTAYILNEYGVMVRSGHHCTQPLMNYLGISSCCRASFSIFNTKEDIDVMVTALKKVNAVFNSR